MRERILTHLEPLIAANTCNPPRTIEPDNAAVRHAAAALRAAGLEIEVTPLGDGAVNIFATRGEPALVAHCHLDTVPVAERWTRDPFALSVEGDRAYGLGAVDVKGVAACLIAAAEASDGPAAILLTTDEEAGDRRCVPAFTAGRPPTLEAAIVCEPTMNRVVTTHRGLVSVDAVFEGTSGHSSCAGAAAESAAHDAVRWASRALGHIQRLEDDLRFNIGVVSGGTKPGVVVGEMLVRFGLRPPAGFDVDGALAGLRDLAPRPEATRWTERYRAPALPQAPQAGAVAEALGVALGDPVDYWSEAAAFAEGGLPAVVFGPGDIARAHGADEYVELDELEAAAGAFRRLFSA